VTSQIVTDPTSRKGPTWMSQKTIYAVLIQNPRLKIEE